MSNFVEIKDKDGVTLGQLPVSKEGGRLRNIVYMTESGVYEKPDWLKFIRIRVQGSGGGGGGTGATGTSQYVCAGHGGAGGYCEKVINAADLAASETVTIGAGGDGGAAGANDASTGGVTSFGAHCTAGGGGGGIGMPAVSNTLNCIAASGNGGGASGGDININGWRVPRAVCTNGAILYSGGANSLFGLGGFAALGGAGNALGYGSGGCGACAPTSTAARAGTPGRPGIIIIEEYE